MKIERNIKTPKTYKEQVQLLKSRNLTIDDEEETIEILKKVNYYRLSAYMLTFKTKEGFYDGTSIRNVYDLYKFDKELRNLLLPLIENIEVAFRTHISYLIAHKYGALGYKERNNFKNFDHHEKMIETFNKETNRSDELFISHHRSEYDGIFPIWVIIEVTSFGTLSKMYNNLLDEDKDEIANKHYDAKGEFIRTWLHSLSNIRNKCAHYGRLYNKNLTITPKLFKADKRKEIKNCTVFANVYIIGRLLRDEHEWDHFIGKLAAIIEQYASVDLKCLGFPEDWENILRSL